MTVADDSKMRRTVEREVRERVDRWRKHPRLAWFVGVAALVYLVAFVVILLSQVM